MIVLPGKHEFQTPVLRSLLNLINGVNNKNARFNHAKPATRARRERRFSDVTTTRTSYDLSYRDHRNDPAPRGFLRGDPRQLRTLSSQALFLGEHEIGIEHQGSLYRLKITRQGKLILNK